MPNTEAETSTGNSEARKQATRPLQDSYAKIAAQLVGSIAPSKTVIRPSSVSLAKTDKKHSSLLGKGEDTKALITNASDLTGLFICLCYC